MAINSVGFLGMDGISQPQDVCVRCYDGLAAAFFPVFYHGSIDENALLRSKFQHKTPHFQVPLLRKPRMIAVFISISGITDALRASTSLVWRRVNSAR